MGLLSWAAKFIRSPLRGADSGTSPDPAKPSPGERKFMLLVGGGTHIYNDWTSNRYELAGHFRGWSYVAIKAICEEVAGMQPQVARVVDEDEAEGEVTKTLRQMRRATSREERRLIAKHHDRRYLRGAARTKALANTQSGDELEPVKTGHPLVKLLRNPNGPDVAWSFFYKLQMFLELCGVAYIWCVPNKLGNGIAELWVIPSHWVHEKGGEDRLVESYEIRPAAGIVPDSQLGFGWFPGMSGRGVIPADQMIKIAYPSPLSITDGYSPIQATGTWIDVSENIDSSRVHTFVNGAMPGVALELDKDMMDPTPEERERMKARVVEEYAGVKNTKKPIVLSPGAKLVPFTQSNVELDCVQSADQVKSWILASHRTGESIVGLAENTTFASMEAAKANFYQSTLKPKLAFMGQVLTEKLAKRFEDDLCIYWPDPTPNDPELRMRKQAQDLEKGVRTVNEVRAEDGLEPYEFGGDDPTMQMGAQTMPWATGQQPDPMMGGGMPGMGGEDGGDLGGLDVEGMLGGDAGGIPTPLGGDGADDEEPGKIPSPLAKRMNGHARNGHAH